MKEKVRWLLYRSDDVYTEGEANRIRACRDQGEESLQTQFRIQIVVRGFLGRKE